MMRTVAIGLLFAVGGFVPACAAKKPGPETTVPVASTSIAPTVSATVAPEIVESPWAADSFPPAMPCTNKKKAEAAKALYALGRGAFDRSNMRDAIKYFRDGYRNDCADHTALKDLGDAYEREAEPMNAVRAYRLYLERAKLDEPTKETFRTKIGNLERKVGKLIP